MRSALICAAVLASALVGGCAQHRPAPCQPSTPQLTKENALRLASAIIRPTPLAAALLVSSALSGCAAPIVDDKEIGYMHRTEVSSAISDCESAGQRATVIYAKAAWRDRMVPVPVDVQCMPRGVYR